jgi:hypothetical protein
MCRCCSAYTIPTPSAAAAAAVAAVGVAALPHQVVPQLRAGLQQLLPSCCKPLHIVLAAGSAGARLIGCCHCIGQFLQDTTSCKFDLDHKPWCDLHRCEGKGLLAGLPRTGWQPWPAEQLWDWIQTLSPLSWVHLEPYDSNGQ